MQGKRVIKLGDREYLVEETFGEGYAVYLAKGAFIPVEGLVGTDCDPEPGTKVVIVARVATPSPEPAIVPQGEHRFRVTVRVQDIRESMFEQILTPWRQYPHSELNWQLNSHSPHHLYDNQAIGEGYVAVSTGNKTVVEHLLGNLADSIAKQVTEAVGVGVAVSVSYLWEKPAHLPGDLLYSILPDDWCKGCGWSAKRRGGVLNAEGYCPKCKER